MGVKNINRVRQKGSVLAMSLIILLILTILGVNSMSSLVLEEKMAGNTRQSMIASQAAEIALRAGEGWVNAQINTKSDVSKLWAGTVGYYSYAEQENLPAAGFDMQDDSTWAANSVDVAGIAAIDPAGIKTTSLSQNPRYIVEYLGRVNEDASEDKLDIINDKTIDKREYAFRVTAIGWGESTNARFMAQSTFRVKL
ncbi:MAG: PilX N-terminal domain-containing pilus assembly protein [Pseudomonadales bacterium]